MRSGVLCDNEAFVLRRGTTVPRRSTCAVNGAGLFRSTTVMRESVRRHSTQRHANDRNPIPSRVPAPEDCC